MKKKKKDLKARGIDESEEGDGKPSVEARGESSSSGSGECDEKKARRNEAKSGNEERAAFGKNFFHRHHGRAPEEERRHQHRSFP